MKFEQLQEINKNIKRIKIKGRPYATVPSRLQGFKALYPEGRICTEILELTDDNVVMKATIHDELGTVIATGHAQESRNASNVNKTSYVENCETSAVGRALGMLGIGSDESMASAEEVRRAIAQQENVPEDDVKVPTEENVNDRIGEGAECDEIKRELERTGVTLEKFLGMFEVDTIQDLTMAQYYVAMNKFKKTESKEKNE